MFEDEVIEILNNWLKDCKIRFYFYPMDLVYRLDVYFNHYNLVYTCQIPYRIDLDAKKIAHRLLSDITKFIINTFIRGDNND